MDFKIKYKRKGEKCLKWKLGTY
uniref:Uncharacterized protein n=1 Tax=Rhizophora mucronata TaxID=61149 RepID=A0A2P2NUJ7_RHIMU